MDAEERWAQRKEWDEERRRGFDVEVKYCWNIPVIDRHLVCGKCSAPARFFREVGSIDGDRLAVIATCAGHDSDEIAIEIYHQIRATEVDEG